LLRGTGQTGRGGGSHGAYGGLDAADGSDLIACLARLDRGFAGYEPAIALYRALGFAAEGIKRRARKLDGKYEDNVFMALIS